METDTTRPLVRRNRRVAMGDVDAARILYFAAPYRWLEELLTGWCKAIEHPVSGMFREGSGCPSVASAAQYVAPLALDDEISVALYPSSIGHTSFSVTAVASRIDDGRVMVKVTSWHAWALFGEDDTGAVTLRAQPLPDWLRDGLAASTLIQPATPRPAATPIRL
ncbi:acyl-CoA thioesterase [Amycolatopsis echigonensis]|uniref:Acyl-CoA thioesterase n=1 Tax=Amycolatopsis echigonensis TaxID=2576905 RepID=A0A8E1W6F4_9PSEU|nr:acyl-CoA thioesterase [Amycolatopsis echigonensis]MBB2505238.1 acyl-CoA thioesterase [Amycolatopsis echigonensis]